MIGLKFRDVLARSSPFVVEEFDNLTASLAGLWGVQHKQDGAHGLIVADGLLAASGLVSALQGRFTTLSVGTFAADSFVASGAGLPARGGATDLVWVDSLGALRKGTLVATDIPTLPESKLSNDSLLARVADNETVSGAWTFSSAPTIAQILSSANLTLSPTGDVVLAPGGKDVLPSANYDTHLGALSKKYLSLHAAELWVETLVAQDTLATIGGRVLVGPTTMLSADLTSVATSITVKHNNLASGDVVYLESGGKVEFLRITSSASGSAGAYTYTVERNKDGTGANEWYAGDALFNTGQSGSGFIDLYSLRGIKSGSEAGPTIVGNVRTASGTSSTDPLVNNFAAWSPRWAIGNLNGLYGYGVTTYGAAFGDVGGSHVLIDATNGIRLRHGSTTKIALDGSGNATFTGTVSSSAISSSDISGGTITGTTITGGTIQTASTGSRVVIDTTPSLKWYNGSTEIGAITSSGIELPARTTGTYDGQRAFKFSGVTYGRLALAGEVNSGASENRLYLGSLANNTGWAALTQLEAYHDSSFKQASVAALASNTASALTLTADTVSASSLLYVVGSTNRVGIGESSPACRLEVSQSDSGVGTITELLRLSRTGASTTSTARGVALSFEDANNQTLTAALVAVRENSSTNYNGALAFRCAEGGGSTYYTAVADLPEKMRLTSAGNLGIGTTTPGARLDVADGAIEFTEISDPAAPSTNDARLYVRDNGSGKTQLCVRFASGAVQVVATEP